MSFTTLNTFNSNLWKSQDTPIVFNLIVSVNDASSTKIDFSNNNISFVIIQAKYGNSTLASINKFDKPFNKPLIYNGLLSDVSYDFIVTPYRISGGIIKKGISGNTVSSTYTLANLPNLFISNIGSNSIDLSFDSVNYSYVNVNVNDTYDLSFNYNVPITISGLTSNTNYSLKVTPYNDINIPNTTILLNTVDYKVINNESILDYDYNNLSDNSLNNIIRNISPWGIYDATMWKNGVLPEARGNGRDAVGSGIIYSSLASGNGASASISYIGGDTTACLTWPSGSIPSKFTICSLTRYSGVFQSQILTSTDISFVHGHGANNNINSGRVFYNIEKSITPITPASNWLVCCGKNGLVTDNNGLDIKLNSVLLNNTPVGLNYGGLGGGRLSINSNFNNQYSPSNWEFSYLMIWDQILRDSDMMYVSQSLMNYLSTGIIFNNKTYYPLYSSYKNLLDLSVNYVIKQKYKFSDLSLNDIVTNKPPWGIYDADMWDPITNKLPEARGNGRDASGNSFIVKSSIVGNGSSVSIPRIDGNISACLNWPTGSIPSKFTICSVTRFTGTNNRILQGKTINWYHGHNTNVRGIANYNNVKSTTTTKGNLTDWLIMCGKNGSSTQNVGDLVNNSVIINDLTPVGYGSLFDGTGNDTLTINNSTNATGSTLNSTWQLSYLIIWDQVLNDKEMFSVSNALQNYLSTGIIYSLRTTKTAEYVLYRYSREYTNFNLPENYLINNTYTFSDSSLHNIVINKPPWAIYDVSMWDSTRLILPEARGITSKDVYGSNLSGNVYTFGSAIGNGSGPSSYINYIGGNITTQLSWPAGSIPVKFTICSISRYSGTEKGQILSSDVSFVHGHNNSYSGNVIYGNVSKSNTNINPVTNWLVCCGKNGLSTDNGGLDISINSILINNIARGLSFGNLLSGPGTMSINKGFEYSGEMFPYTLGSTVAANVFLTSNTLTKTGLTGITSFMNGIYDSSSSSYYNVNYQPYCAFDNSMVTPFTCAYDINSNPKYDRYPYNVYPVDNRIIADYQGGNINGSNYFTTSVSGLSYPGEWLQIKLPYKFILNSYNISNFSLSWSSVGPATFYVAGSNDGSIWNLLDSQNLTSPLDNNSIPPYSGSPYPSAKFNIINNNTSYSFYRLIINKTFFNPNDANRIGNVSIRNWKLSGKYISTKSDWELSKLFIWDQVLTDSEMYSVSIALNNYLSTGNMYKTYINNIKKFNIAINTPYVNNYLNTPLTVQYNLNNQYTFIDPSLNNLVISKPPWGIYDASMWNATTYILPELRGNGRDASGNNRITKSSADGNGAIASISYIGGDISACLNWPSNSISSQFTICSVTRYSYYKPELYFPFNGNILNYATGVGIDISAVRVGVDCSFGTGTNVRVGTGSLFVSLGTSTTNNSYLKLNNTITNKYGYTFAFWIYLQGSTQNGEGIIWSFSNSIDTSKRIYLKYSSGNFYISTNNTDNIFYSPSPTTWYHIAWTLDKNGNSIIYVNGSLQNTFTSTSTPYISYIFNKNYLLGDPSNNIGFYGILDEFYYFDGVLPQSEILKIYTNNFLATPNTRILQGKTLNWYHGHNASVRGIANYNKVKSTTTSNGIPTDWLIMCGKNGLIYNNEDDKFINSVIINDGTSTSIGLSFDGSGNDILTINNSTNVTGSKLKSDWGFSFLFIWDQILNDNEMTIVSNALRNYLNNGTLYTTNVVNTTVQYPVINTPYLSIPFYNQNNYSINGKKYSDPGLDYIVRYKPPWGIYDAAMWNPTTYKLPEARGNGRDASGNNLIVKGLTIGNGSSSSISYIGGGTTALLNWPTSSIPSRFTICSITRFTGTNNRILQGKTLNWCHGHNTNVRGIANYNNVKSTATTKGTISDWLIMSGKNASSYDYYSKDLAINSVIINDNLYSFSSIGSLFDGSGNDILTINNSTVNPSLTSTWQFSYLIIWDQILTDKEMLTVNYAFKRYLLTGNMYTPYLNPIDTIITKPICTLSNISNISSLIATNITKDRIDISFNYNFSDISFVSITSYPIISTGGNTTINPLILSRSNIQLPIIFTGLSSATNYTFNIEFYNNLYIKNKNVLTSTFVTMYDINFGDFYEPRYSIISGSNVTNFRCTTDASFNLNNIIGSISLVPYNGLSMLSLSNTNSLTCSNQIQDINGFICVIYPTDNGAGGIDTLFSDSATNKSFNYARKSPNSALSTNDINYPVVYVNGVYQKSYDLTNSYNIMYVNFPNTTFGNLKVGNVSSSGFSGYIGDIFCLKNNHTYADRQMVEGYLAWKWGLNSLLPMNHPFYYFDNKLNVNPILYDLSVNQSDLSVNAITLNYKQYNTTYIIVDKIGTTGYIGNVVINTKLNPSPYIITGLDPNTYYNFSITPYNGVDISSNTYYISGFTGGVSTFMSSTTAITSSSTPINYSNIGKPLCTLSRINSVISTTFVTTSNYNINKLIFVFSCTDLSYVNIICSNGINTVNSNISKSGSGIINSLNGIYDLPNLPFNITSLTSSTTFSYSLFSCNNLNISNPIVITGSYILGPLYSTTTRITPYIVNSVNYYFIKFISNNSIIFNRNINANVLLVGGGGSGGLGARLTYGGGGGGGGGGAGKYLTINTTFTFNSPYNIFVSKTDGNTTLKDNNNNILFNAIKGKVGTSGTQKIGGIGGNSIEYTGAKGYDFYYNNTNGLTTGGGGGGGGGATSNGTGGSGQGGPRKDSGGSGGTGIIYLDNIEYAKGGDGGNGGYVQDLVKKVKATAGGNGNPGCCGNLIISILA